jgi:hypothetical protein
MLGGIAGSTMISDYLSKEGDLLSFGSAEEFKTIIGSLDLQVPSRNKGRKSFHRERSSVVLYLKAMVHFSQVRFPFTIRKLESPDFVLEEDGGQTIGIEHRDNHLREMAAVLNRIYCRPAH